jgi:hypothetical protein
MGIIEKDGRTFYCAAILIGKYGTLLSRHRKVPEFPFIRARLKSGAEIHESSSQLGSNVSSGVESLET